MQLWNKDTAYLFKLRKLLSLTLDGNNLTRVPAEIGVLKSTLKYLTLNNNIHLENLPQEIGLLSQLSYLDVRNNSISFFSNVTILYSILFVGSLMRLIKSIW